MFSIEQAHWHYLDYYCNNTKNNEYSEYNNYKFLPKVSLRKFTIQILNKYPFLISDVNPNVTYESLMTNPDLINNCIDKLINQFQEYKRLVPTYGAIIIDKTYKYCLMVRGANSRVSWGFPKGKRNQDELAKDCAIREVQEEIGFDCSNLITSNNTYLETQNGHQSTGLFLVTDVDINQVNCYPTTRNEIRDIKWFLIDELPDERKIDTGRVCVEENLNSGNFFMAIAFISPLRKYCRNKRAQMFKNNRLHVDDYLDDYPPPDVCKLVANHREMTEMLRRCFQVLKLLVIKQDVDQSWSKILTPFFLDNNNTCITISQDKLHSLKPTYSNRPGGANYNFSRSQNYKDRSNHYQNEHRKYSSETTGWF